MSFRGWQGDGYHQTKRAEPGYNGEEWAVTYLAQNVFVVDRCSTTTVDPFQVPGSRSLKGSIYEARETGREFFRLEKHLLASAARPVTESPRP